MPRKGYIPTEEHRRKLSEKKKGDKHPFFNKHHTEEAKKRISDYRRRNDPMLGKEDQIKNDIDKEEEYISEDVLIQARIEHQKKSQNECEKLEKVLNAKFRRNNKTDVERS